MAVAAKTDVFMPRALLVRNENEADDWIHNIFNKISKELRENHVAVTTDMKEIETVHMTIVFLNATFVKNCHQLFQQFINNAFQRRMLLTAVVYENNDDSKLVSQIFKLFEGEFPQDFDFNTDDLVTKKKLTKSVLDFFNETNTVFCNLPYSNNNKFVIKGLLDSFINQVVTDLNPFHLDFTKIQPELLSEVVDMCHKIENVRNLGYRRYQPLLALFEFQPCLEHNCSSQMMTMILQLLYTLNNIYKHREFHYRRLYVSMPQHIKNDGPPPSFVDVFRSALKARYPNRSYVSFSHQPFLIVIDDFQSFVPKGEDPKYMLAVILEQLGQGGLIITSIPNSLKLGTESLGPMRETPQCIHSPPNRIRQTWPICYPIFCEKLGRLAMEDFVEDEADAKEAEEDESKKNLHSIVFDLSGNEEKKLRGAY